MTTLNALFYMNLFAHAIHLALKSVKFCSIKILPKIFKMYYLKFILKFFKLHFAHYFIVNMYTLLSSYLQSHSNIVKNVFVTPHTVKNDSCV